MRSFGGNEVVDNAPRPKTYLYLYVADESPNSVRAIANLEAICREYFEEGCYVLTVIDVMKDPLRALNDEILVTPTLICLGAPSVRILGDLSDREMVVRSLGLSDEAE
jgi:circadian clock protein KaiB